MIRAISCAVLLALVDAGAQDPPEQARRTAEILLIAEDDKGASLRDLRAGEVVLNQEGVYQEVDALVLEGGVYCLRYRPKSGQLGRIQISLKRLHTRLRGPSGPAVTVRWQDTLEAFEIPLVEALDAGAEPNDLGILLTDFEFEMNDKGTHRTFLVVVPPSIARGGSEQASCEGHFMMRVRSASGAVVTRQSQRRILYSSPRTSLGWAFWPTHIHLKPGQYTVEAVVRDACTNRLSVQRAPLNVAPTPAGLRLSAVIPLFNDDNVSLQDDSVDNPFLVGGRILIPTIPEATFPEIGNSGRHFYVVFYPDPASPERMTASFQVLRGGVALAEAIERAGAERALAEWERARRQPRGGRPVTRLRRAKRTMRDR